MGLPTKRGWMLVAVALVLYFFANQTQVGWLYVLAAITAGLGLAAWPVPRRMLRDLSLTRRLNGQNASDLELHAGDSVSVDLEFRNTARFPALQIRGLEICPLAPAADRTQNFFISTLSPRSPLTLNYETTCARRGWFEFPPVQLSTRAPFGFFSARREVSAPTGVLVFPEYREIEHVALFDRMPAVEAARPRLGSGGEFVGVREYRPGDSRRHIHWRSTARVGRLVVKEFAEETQPGLTIALDLRESSLIGSGDDSSLELGIKIAATLARYAQQRGLPVSLAANSRAWPAPPGPVSWWGVMNYLARVQGEGEESFAECLCGLRATQFVAALLTIPDEAVIASLIELQRQGIGVLTVVIDPAPFLPVEWGGTHRAQDVASSLAAEGLSTCVIGDEPDWERTLEDEESGSFHRRREARRVR
jgi:uncharacterized protein (DUF58 family)